MLAVAAESSRTGHTASRNLRAASKRRHERWELDVGHCGAECLELPGIQEHVAALAAGEEPCLMPSAILPHYADPVITLECADSAAPNAARYRNGRGHGEIVGMLVLRCPFRSLGEQIQYGRAECQEAERDC